MSRSNYSDDCCGSELYLYRGSVDRAIAGRRGQAFLREMVEALEAMPFKRLAAGLVFDVESGERCAMGAVVAARGIDVVEVLGRVNQEQDAGFTASVLDIAESLAREIAFENDEEFFDGEDRYEHMLEWAKARLREPKPPAKRARCLWCRRLLVVRRGEVVWHKYNGAPCPGIGGSALEDSP